MTWRTLTAGSAAGAVALLGATAQAEPSGPGRFCDNYPDAAACAVNPPACTLCHTSTDVEDPAWNLYGEDLRTELGDTDFDVGIAAALAAVEELDSDGDGFSNLEEIESGTKPGDPLSAPAVAMCPPQEHELAYDVCSYDPVFVYRKMYLDFCGHQPSFSQYDSFAAADTETQMQMLDAELDTCLDTEFWRGREGVLWQLALPKVRPVRALKSGVNPSSIEQLQIADWTNDLMLYAYTQVDGNDARDVLLADYYALQDGTEFTQVDDIGAHSGLACVTDDDCPANETCGDEGTCGCFASCLEAVIPERRQGLLTTRWVLLYNTMFTAIPRTTAAQAYRAFLGLDIAKQEGLFPADGEPADYDDKGVDAPQCAVCHETLDPLTYPFTRYQGFGPQRATYYAERMTDGYFDDEGPNIADTPEAGMIFGQQVDDLGQWADVAANSDQFAQAAVGDYWQLLMGRAPSAQEAVEFAELWTDFRGTHGYSVEAMLHDFIKTEAYGAP